MSCVIDPIIKDIPGYEGMYQISENGEIYNTKSGVELKKQDNGYGYLVCTLKNKKYYVHRLVALTFIKNQENKKCVDHIDGNKKNNFLYNLRWSTHSENNLNNFINKNNTSGYKGIYLDKKLVNRYYWSATIKKNKKIYSKNFTYNEEGYNEAVLWRKYKEIELFGEFSKIYNEKDDILKKTELYIDKWNKNEKNIPSTNTSGYLGIVFKNKSANAYVTINGKRINKSFKNSPEGIKLAIKWREEQLLKKNKQS